MLLSDRERQVDHGTAAAFESFGSELLRFAARRMRDADRAEDIVQEAFLRLATESRAGRYPTNRRSWLYRVVLNLIISEARHAAIARREAGHLQRDVVVTDTPEILYLVSERDRGVGAALEVIRAEGTGQLSCSRRTATRAARSPRRSGGARPRHGRSCVAPEGASGARWPPMTRHRSSGDRWRSS